MDHAHIATFEQHSGTLTAAVDRLVVQADALRDLTDEARVALSRCHRAVAVLRRTQEPELMGPLNSLSAAHARHQSLGGALEDLEAALSRFEDVARDLRLLHPATVAALRDKLTAVTAARGAAEPAP